MKRSSFTLLTALVLAGYAHAAPIAINISAQVNSVFDTGNFLGGAINVGDTITGTYIYESTTPDSSPSPNFGIYIHTTTPFGITLHVGGLVFRTDPSQVNFLVGITNDQPSVGDVYLLRSRNNIFDKSALSGPPLDNHISWQLDDPTGTALSSDALPTGPPVLADWQSTIGLRISSENMRDRFIIDADVTSAVLIPEPSSSLLLCVGLSSLLGYWLWMGKFSTVAWERKLFRLNRG